MPALKGKLVPICGARFGCGNRDEEKEKAAKAEKAVQEKAEKAMAKEAAKAARRERSSDGSCSGSGRITASSRCGKVNSSGSAAAASTSRGAFAISSDATARVPVQQPAPPPIHLRRISHRNQTPYNEGPGRVHNDA